MRAPREPEPATVFIGVLFAEGSARERAWQMCTQRLGCLRRLGEPLPFNWTQYYERELGPSLTREFWVVTPRMPRQGLASLKRWTCRLEAALALPDGRRTVNLDPGLLSAENVVLATTKGFSHRVYLEGGIYAEVSLICREGRFEALPWTYPDYRTSQVLGWLGQERERFLRERGNPGDPSAALLEWRGMDEEKNP